MSHKNISFPLINKVFLSKAITITSIEQYLQNHKDEFEDANLITFRYKSADNEDVIYPSTATIHKTEESIKLHTSIDNEDTIKVLDNDSDIHSLWIDDTETGSTFQYLEDDLTELKLTVSKLKEMVNIHDYAFTHGMNSGNLANSTICDMENSADRIPPVGREDNPDEELVEIEPNYSCYADGNVKHIMIKYADTEQEIKKYYSKYLCWYELIWCLETKSLYINNKGTLVKINAFTEGGGSSSTTNVEGITSSEDAVDTITMRSENGTLFTVKIDNDGRIISYDKKLDKENTGPTYTPAADGTVTDLYLKGLYINMVYCGGLDSENEENTKVNEHCYNYCSHNFVELSNLTNNDINLNGLSLQYAKDGSTWEVLPLFGTIKKGSTFLIRGSQCSVMDVNTTKIKVKTFDMEWIDSKTKKLIQFSNKSAKFYLTYGTTPCNVQNPMTDVNAKVLFGYIDFVGFQGEDNPGGYEGASAMQISNKNAIFTKYYTMDIVSNAGNNKTIKNRNNANDWNIIQLDKENGEIIPNIEVYTPKSSAEGKDMFFNKTKIEDGKPAMITCSLGIQGTDSGQGATRCFNWISKNYYDEYLWISNDKDDFSEAEKIESFKGYTNKMEPEYYYNRIRMEASDGIPFTVHKVIKRNLIAGTYYYKAGRTLETATDVHSFTVSLTSEVNANGFNFIQTSDQQGFNWDEYQVWKWASKKIASTESPEFMINTGDMVQNGNRMNEWLDYFNAKEGLSELEEMATIGNNDLCPVNPYELVVSSDTQKQNPVNITFFYTFELDKNNMPVFTVEKDGKEYNNIYVPSIYSFNYGNTHFICMNSEITATAENQLFGVEGVDDTDCGYVYNEVMKWCQKDIDNASGSTWKVAYCHEMPFTILTSGVTSGAVTEKTATRKGGSHLNDVAFPENKYWFSKFCENNDIRLVIGGHKHTEAISYPLKENVNTDILHNTLKPIIQVTSDMLSEYFNSTYLVTITKDTSLAGQKLPNGWFDDIANEVISTNYQTQAHLCTFELVDKISAPIYAMSQSTGYKHTSNKELPGPDIPWLKFYYAIKNGDTKPNSGQRYPFYTTWNITNDKIVGEVKTVRGIFNAGKFNVNRQGEYVKNGQASKNDSVGYTINNVHTIEINK